MLEQILIIGGVAALAFVGYRWRRRKRASSGTPVMVDKGGAHKNHPQ